MQASDRQAIRLEKIAQHATACERELKMQFVHPPQEGQISR
jgi:hypothetical protein